MHSKQELITGFEQLIPYVETLDGLGDEVWLKPIGEGKWCVRDVVAHILLWDKYFLENGVEKLILGQPVTIEELDFDEFNRGAVEYAKTKPRRVLIEQTIQARTEILRLLQLIPEDAYGVEHVMPNQSKFVIAEYVKDFTWHDSHHRAQIEALM